MGTNKLKVRADLLESTCYYPHAGSSYGVKLSEATPEQLQHIKDAGVDVFEKPVEKAEK